jgi:hypothetical protein
MTVERQGMYGYEWGAYVDAYSAASRLLGDQTRLIEPANPQLDAYQQTHLLRYDALQEAAQEHDVPFSSLGYTLLNKTLQLVASPLLEDGHRVLSAHSHIAVQLPQVETSRGSLDRQLALNRLSLRSQPGATGYEYVISRGDTTTRFTDEFGHEITRFAALYDEQHIHAGITGFRMGEAYGGHLLPADCRRYIHAAGLALDAYEIATKQPHTVHVEITPLLTTESLGERVSA